MEKTLRGHKKLYRSERRLKRFEPAEPLGLHRVKNILRCFITGIGYLNESVAHIFLLVHKINNQSYCNRCRNDGSNTYCQLIIFHSSNLYP